MYREEVDFEYDEVKTHRHDDSTNEPQVQPRTHHCQRLVLRDAVTQLLTQWYVISTDNIPNQCSSLIFYSSSERLAFHTVRLREDANTTTESRCGGLEHTHTHPYNGPLFRTTRVSWYQKCKTNLDFYKARDRVAVVSAGLYASLHLVPDR